VMLETFRADLLGAREQGREVTPVLNALARQGVSSSRAYSHNGYTVQSKYHLFAGRLGQEGASGTLLEDFKNNGYEVAYFSGQDESFGGPAGDIGAERADAFYDARQDKARRYTTFTTAGSLGVSSDVVLERIAAFLDARDRARPLFLFANFYDTHFPYDHDGIETLVSDARLSQAEIVPARAEELRRMYLNAAANVDRAVGRLLDAVTAHLGEAPVTVILADHGESLFDEGYLGHGYTINDVQTRIPLVVRGAPLALCEPLGQADLRAALTNALSAPEGGTTPTIRDCGERRVFQYLGTLDTPRQIAFVGGRGRITYDLRERVARLDDGPWLTPDRLSPAEQRDMEALVHFWERLRLQDVPPAGRLP
jgi:arylsulfatase A-like enzyme